jgi:DNA polymerase-3 subunit beta
MIATINKNELKNALNLAAKCLDVRNTIPILAFLKLNFEGGALTICGTNLDQTASITIPATVEGELEVCVDGKLFAALVSKLQGDTVKITYKGDNLVICRPSGDASLRTANAEDFPLIATNEKAKGFVSFKTYDIQNTFKAILCGTAEDSVQSSSNIAEFNLDTNLIETKFTCYSTDKNRLAVITGLCEKEDETDKTPVRFNFPIYAVKILLPALSGLVKEYEKIYFAEDDRHIFVKFDDTFYYVFRKLTGELPNIKIYLDRFAPYAEMSVENSALLNALDVVSLFSDARTRRVRVDVSTDDIQISANSAEAGEIEESVGITSQDKEFTTAYDSQYLIPIFRNFGGDFRLAFKREELPTVSDKPPVITYPLRITPERNGINVDFYVQSLNIKLD